VQVLGGIVYGILSFPTFAYIIFLFRGYRPVAWLLWFIMVDACVKFVSDAIDAYKHSAPKRALYRWISETMRKPAYNDPRLYSDICAICFAQPNSADEVRVTSCNHMYHITCLAQWLSGNTTCPTCRRQLRQMGIFF
jgi:Ring finger domain